MHILSLFSQHRTPLAIHTAWLVSAEPHLQGRDVTQTQKKAGHFFCPGTGLASVAAGKKYHMLTWESRVKWKNAAVHLLFHHQSFQCWRVCVAVCHTLSWISPLGLWIFEAEQCSWFVHECTGMQLQKSFTRWNVALAFPLIFGKAVSKYAPQSLSNSNKTEEKVATKLLSLKYFKECLIPQSSQTFIFEQDEEATAV